jgi:hypothetical protein
MADLGPATRAHVLARGVLTFAWRRQSPTVLPNPLEVVPAKTMPRRMLPQEGVARIDELTLQIGPAFRAAMQRSGEKGDIKK